MKGTYSALLSPDPSPNTYNVPQSARVIITSQCRFIIFVATDDFTDAADLPDETAEETAQPAYLKKFLCGKITTDRYDTDFSDTDYKYLWQDFELDGILADSYCTIRNEKQIFCSFSLNDKTAGGVPWYATAILYRRNFEFDDDIIHWYNKYTPSGNLVDDDDDVDEVLFDQCCMWWYYNFNYLGITEC